MESWGGAGGETCVCETCLRLAYDEYVGILGCKPPDEGGIMRDSPPLAGRVLETEKGGASASKRPNVSSATSRGKHGRGGTCVCVRVCFVSVEWAWRAL